MKYSSILSVLLFMATGNLSNADVLILKHGQVIAGTVMHTNDAGITMKLDSSTMTYPYSLVKDLHIGKKNAVAATESGQRIPAWAEIISRLYKCGWSVPIRQIPATVIETGIFKNVPYLSFQCAYGYEVNIYGDLENPAGFEIGLQPKLLGFAIAKTNCLDFVVSTLPQKTDRDIIHSLNASGDKTTKDGYTFEVTPPTADDSYGGWWISVYSEEALNKARASDVEMKEITQSVMTAPEPEPVQPRITYQPAKNPQRSEDAPATSWSQSDFGSATPIRSYSSGNRGGGGSVYVHGYTRKDGTYVRPHTRRSSRR